MNKKQLIIVWITGVLIILICLNAPTMVGGYKLPGVFHEIDLPRTILSIIAVLILGGLTIYTVRDKKK